MRIKMHVPVGVAENRVQLAQSRVLTLVTPGEAYVLEVDLF